MRGVNARLSSITVLSVATLVSCVGRGDAVRAPTTAVVVLDPPAPTQVDVPPPAADPLAAFVGRYHITGTARSDGCSGALYLAANMVDVGSTGHLSANVVNREYDARVEGDRLIAEGSFPAQVGCEGDLFERWTFRRSAGGLEGELESEWPFPPNCATRCRVVFTIHATRAEAGHDAGPGE
jgi:hypothetical protein